MSEDHSRQIQQVWAPQRAAALAAGRRAVAIALLSWIVAGGGAGCGRTGMSLDSTERSARASQVLAPELLHEMERRSNYAIFLLDAERPEFTRRDRDLGVRDIRGRLVR